jgi:hypothetical protein
MSNSDNVTDLLGTLQGNQCKLREKEEYQISKEEIRKICSSLCYKSNEYAPFKTVTILKNYINNDTKLDRMLYSEITNRIYGMDERTRGTFLTNVESLLVHTLDLPRDIECDCRKIVVKIFDHCQLANYQIENAANIAKKSNEGVRDKIIEEVNRDMKVIEREYITILGIFASIVLAFMGGISFSAATLNAMKEVSIFRLLLIVDLLAFILVNSIALLTSVISKDNKGAEEKVQSINAEEKVQSINKEKTGLVKFKTWLVNKKNRLVIFNVILLIIAGIVIFVSIKYPSLLKNL